MKDPRRILEQELLAPDAATDMLRAAALEEPPAGAMERLLDVLAVPAAGSGGEAHLSGVRPALRAAGKSSAKLGLRFALLSGGGVSLLVAAWLATHPTAPAARAPDERAPVLQPRAAAPELQAPPPVEAPTPVAETPQTERRAHSLAQEIASLDQVRQLLARGEPTQALAALRRHARTYSGGALQQEASLLRIEALSRAGQLKQARALAVRFLKEHPDSPHRERVRALVSEAHEAP